MSLSDEVEGFYVLKAAYPKTTATGKPFLSASLSDRSDSIEIKVWDYSGPISSADEGNVVKIRGTVSEFRGTPQITVDPDRVYDFIPYTGFGYNRLLDKPHTRALAVNFGIINRFRITDAWDINLELSGMVTEDRFDGKVQGKAADMTIGASLGFAYNFPQRGFKHVPDVNAIMALSASQMDAINAALAEQIAQNQKLKKQLANQQPVEVVNEKVIVKEVPAAPQSIFFEIGSSVLPPKSEVNLQTIAQMMKDNPNMTLSLTGYADSDTGSAAWNKQLSENRANAVADALVKLGVNKNRLAVVGKGGVETLTPPSFNRRVIIEAQ